MPRRVTGNYLIFLFDFSSHFTAKLRCYFYFGINVRILTKLLQIVIEFLIGSYRK
jgi:hypothetical protein